MPSFSSRCHWRRGNMNFSSHGQNSSGNHGKTIWLFLAIIVLVIVLIGVALAVPRLRRLAADKARPKLRQVWEDLKVLATQPAKLVELIGGHFRPSSWWPSPWAPRFTPSVSIYLWQPFSSSSPSHPCSVASHRCQEAWEWWRPE